MFATNQEDNDMARARILAFGTTTPGRSLAGPAMLKQAEHPVSRWRAGLKRRTQAGPGPDRRNILYGGRFS